MSETRTCKACGLPKPLTNFYAHRHTCKLCTLAATKKYRVQNLDKWKAQSVATRKRYYDKHRLERCKESSNYVKRKRAAGLFNKERKNANERARRAKCIGAERQKQSEYRSKNKQKLAEYFCNYVVQNRDRIRGHKKKWKKNNPEIVHLYKRQDARRRRQSLVGTVTAKEWKRILLFYGRACGKCSAPEAVKPLTIDHWIPISKGGPNIWQNVWPLCIDCNVKKRVIIPDEPYPPHVQIFERTGT